MHSKDVQIHGYDVIGLLTLVGAVTSAHVYIQAQLQVVYIAADHSASSFHAWSDVSPDVTDMLFPTDDCLGGETGAPNGTSSEGGGHRPAHPAATVTSAYIRDIQKRTHEGGHEVLPVLVDFAAFDAEVSNELCCARSRILLSEACPSPNPVVAIGNYLFDRCVWNVRLVNVVLLNGRELLCYAFPLLNRHKTCHRLHVRAAFVRLEMLTCSVLRSLSTDVFAVTTDNLTDKVMDVPPSNDDSGGCTVKSLDECLLTLKATKKTTTNPTPTPDCGGDNPCAVQRSSDNAMADVAHKKWRSEDITHFSKTWSRRSILTVSPRAAVPTLYYLDAHLNALLTKTAHRLSTLSLKQVERRRLHQERPSVGGSSAVGSRTSCFTIPCGGLKCFSRLRKFSSPGVLMSLIADKGFSRYDACRERYILKECIHPLLLCAYYGIFISKIHPPRFVFGYLNA